MKRHEIDCWEVYTSYDRDVSHVAYFSSEYLASDYISKAKDKVYMGKQRVRKVFVIFDSLDEVTQYSRENLRKSALAKLSPAEIDALGITV